MPFLADMGVRVSWSEWYERPEVGPAVSIIVPVWNEADNVLELTRRIKAALSTHRTEVLFIDDSFDNQTEEAIVQAAAAYNTDNFTVDFYHRTGEQRWGGLSGAVSDGIQRAQSDRILVMDGDLQHPPETIPDMLAASESHDVVVASRYCQGGDAGGLDGLIRRVVSSSSTWLAKTFFPWRLRKVSDPMTGFFYLNRQAIDTKKLRPKGFKILLEILATHPKLRVTEVPLQFAERLNGESHGDLKQGREFVLQLLDLRFGQILRVADQAPKFVQFGIIGGSVFAFGTALLFVLVEALGWSPLLANALQLAVTLWLNYILNRKITWRERTVDRLAAAKFFVSRGATTLLNYGLFAWLINLQLSFNAFGQHVALSVNYLVANILALIIVMLINYVSSDRWAFAQASSAGNSTFGTIASIGFVATAAIGFALNPGLTASLLLALIGLALFVQSSVEVWRMLYTYRVPGGVDSLRFPLAHQPQERFCLIVPARHESAVLDNTLRQLATQTHPSVDIITVICDDDYDTLRVAYNSAATNPRIRVIQYPLERGAKTNKPLQLNYVLSQIDDDAYSVIGVVDAEDTVHFDLLTRIDAAFRDPQVGIVQGGVQLMNHNSSWYSLHNVLEYYRWFSSAMAFQAASNFMPLGGNTIFIREALLRKAGGWPVTLTEDCSLGVLLSSRFQTKTAVYYEPDFATREETPDTLKGLFKQRVRWNQGFFHEWKKGVWRELPSFRQRLLASYVLLGPVILASITVFMIISILAALMLNAPVGLVLLMYLPLVPTTLLGVLNLVFLHDFGEDFQRKVSAWHYVVLLATQIPYQVVLNAAAFWSVVRELRGETSWYKTSHSGQHRELAAAPAEAYANGAVTGGQ
jgi:glycosyltransferase XagB